MTSIYQDIIRSAIAGNQEVAGKLFEFAMAREIKHAVADYKSVVGSNMFESANSANSFIPAKRNWRIEAVDPTANTEEYPKGQPISYHVNSYGPATAYAVARNRGHESVKVFDPETGEDKTAHGEHEYNYGIRESATSCGDDSLNSKYENWRNATSKGDEGFRFISKASTKDTVHAIKDGKSYGTFNIMTGEHTINEDTMIGNVDATATAQAIAQREQENRAQGMQAASQAAPTMNDVVSVLGNTVSVTDQQAAK